MNKTKIEWTDATLNPVVGCNHGCSYCYARRMAKRQLHRCYLCYKFIPHFHEERLDRLNKYQKPKKIFIDSMWDWNCKENDIKWLLKIIGKMKECDQHIFQILSKRPKQYERFEFPKNVWLGTSICKTEDCYRVIDLLDNKSPNIKFVSIEPIHENINFWISKLDWIIVGAETGKKSSVKPERSWIDNIIENSRIEKIPLFIKDNVYNALSHKLFEDHMRKDSNNKDSIDYLAESFFYDVHHLPEGKKNPLFLDMKIIREFPKIES